ncbi:MAG: nucleoside-diphosphate sugar epimerase [Planctomycetota bacterium]|nr:MAG: nucleoside-diphosphate sugar epimerase [Planctomycetota bacterium]
MRVLITGGAGFIGSHLAEILLQNNHSVICLDNLSTGSKENIKHLLDNPHLRFVENDIFNAAVVEDLIREVDVVVHLAAAVGVKLIVEDPVSTIETNIYGTQTILSAALKHNTKVLIASSSEVYGKLERIPLSEEDDMLFGPTIHARWCYACSKAVDEFLALAYHRKTGLPVVIMRFFNIVGPRQTGRYGMVVPRFVEQALTNRPITVYSDGSQVRCFLYVREAVDAVMKLLYEQKAVGKVINIGHPEPITILQLAQIVKKLVNPNADITFIPYEQVYGKGFEDIKKRVPSVEKAARLIGFAPKVGIEEIIQITADWMKRRIAPP